MKATGEHMNVRGIWAGVAIAGLLITTVACDSLDKRMALKKANEMYKAQRYEEAITEYKKILAKDPNDWDANYLTAVSYLALYHPGSTHEKDVMYSDEAIKHFEKLMTLTAPSADAKTKARGYYLGILDAAQKPEKAVAFLEGELQKDPGNTSLMSQIALLYQKSGDFPNALKYFQKAADLNPTKKEAWYTVGVACWARSYHGGIMVSQEDREAAVDTGIKAMDKALALDSDYFDALSYINLLYREKAKVLHVAGKDIDAQEAVKKADEYQKRALDLRKKLMQAPGGTAKAS
jgi:tetratricopeptide (TPR) repeat protein